MLGSAIVVFREVFEIVLIVGIVLAATQNMPHRFKAIAIGMIAGLAGAGLLALFTDKVSEMAEGVGQEYFNAGVLFTAALFISWTLLWMKKHSRNMKQKFEQLGKTVTEGDAPFLVLSAVIGLAILREGSEIVLFTYGMLASGQSAMSILGGATLGMIGGLVVGGLFYFGLIRLSMKLFFQVTSGLLILLVAGMMSQAFGFLVAAGDFENLSQTMWDSSALLTEDSIIGQTLGVMIGYTSRPVTIQVIAFALTVISLLAALKMVEKNIGLRSLLTQRTSSPA